MTGIAIELQRAITLKTVFDGSIARIVLSTPRTNVFEYTIDPFDYVIMSEVKQLTDGVITFGPGTLYTSIARLLRAGLIEESRRRADFELNNEPRRHFRLTAVGERVLAEDSRRRADGLRYADVLQAVRCV